MNAGDLCVQNEHVIVSMWFKQPNRRLYMGISLDEQRRNQIDDILINGWRSAMQSANTLPGADCGRDNKLLMAKLRVKLRMVEKKSKTRTKYDLENIYSINE